MSRLRCALVVPTAAAETTGAFWSAALGWPLRAGSQESGNLAHLTPPDGPPCLHLHHVDDVTGQVLLLVECVDQEQTSARHVCAGATVIKDPWGDWPWQLLRSPGGLAYSLVPPTTGIPSPVRFGGHRRHRSRCRPVGGPGGGAGPGPPRRSTRMGGAAVPRGSADVHHRERSPITPGAGHRCLNHPRRTVPSLESRP